MLWNQVPYIICDLASGAERTLTSLAEWPSDANASRAHRKFVVKEPMVPFCHRARTHLFFPSPTSLFAYIFAQPL